MKHMLMKMSLKSKTFLKSEMKNIEIHFKNEKESKFSYDFELNVKMKVTLEIRIFWERNFALMGHHRGVYKLLLWNSLRVVHSIEYGSHCILFCLYEGGWGAPISYFSGIR